MNDGEVVMPDHSLPTLFTLEQTAEFLQASTKTIRRWIETKELIAHKIGHQWRISEPDLQNFINTRSNS
jgi:excisionase family DNA binding protein